MQESIKFDPKKLAKLNNPDRKKNLNPDRIWKFLELVEPQVLIDIGAGTGFFAIPFLEKMKNGKIYACDISVPMLTWMEENLGEFTDQIVPLKMEEIAVPLSDKIADLVYMMNLHHELEAPEKMLHESKRLLKKGGKLMIIDWKKEEMDQGPPKSIRIEESEIVEQMKSAGFKNIAISKELPQHNFIVGTR